jgi:hypothetical protein
LNSDLTVFLMEFLTLAAVLLAALLLAMKLFLPRQGKTRRFEDPYPMA